MFQLLLVPRPEDSHNLAQAEVILVPTSLQQEGIEIILESVVQDNKVMQESNHL